MARRAEQAVDGETRLLLGRPAKVKREVTVGVFADQVPHHMFIKERHAVSA